MNKFMSAVGALALLLMGVVILLAVSWVGTYNTLNQGRESVAARMGDVEATLQRRHDLIPALVNTVKGYAKHEEKVFQEVTEARAKVGQINLAGVINDPAKMQAFQKAQTEMSSALSRLLVVSEQYPELKASENFKDLQAQLEGTENRINRARQVYNKSTENYNTSVGGFFGQFVAGVHGFKKAEAFAADAGAKTAPVVNFE